MDKYSSELSYHRTRILFQTYITQISTRFAYLNKFQNIISIISIICFYSFQSNIPVIFSLLYRSHFEMRSNDLRTLLIPYVFLLDLKISYWLILFFFIFLICRVDSKGEINAVGEIWAHDSSVFSFTLEVN